MSFIRQRLREELTDNKVSSLGSKFLSVPKNGLLDDNEINNIKNIRWEDLVLTPMNEDSPVKIKVDVPWESKISDGIDVFILLTGNDLYQIDINLAKELQGMGIGYKIYLSTIMNFGHLYSGKGRRHNNSEVPKIWEKLKNEPKIKCFSTQKGDICIYLGAENRNEILGNFKKIK